MARRVKPRVHQRLAQGPRPGRGAGCVPAHTGRTAACFPTSQRGADEHGAWILRACEMLPVIPYVPPLPSIPLPVYPHAPPHTHTHTHAQTRAHACTHRDTASGRVVMAVCSPRSAASRLLSRTTSFNCLYTCGQQNSNFMLEVGPRLLHTQQHSSTNAEHNIVVQRSAQCSAEGVQGFY